MSLTKYRAFLTAVEYGSITKAADLLGYTQPAVSHMIVSLEEKFGIPLLIRGKDGVFPTEDAKIFIFHMRQMVNSEDKLIEAAQKITGIDSGTLRIGSFPSISIRWIPSILKEFKKLHPNVDFRLYEGAQRELNQYLEDGQIDIALMSESPPSDFVFLPLKRDPIYAVLPKGHVLAQRRTVRLKELAQYPLILPPEQIDLDVWRVVGAENLQPQALLRIHGDHMIVEMVGRGLGVSLMPRLAITRPLSKVSLRPLNRKHFRTLGLTFRSLKYASPSMKEFIRITEEIVKNLEKR